MASAKLRAALSLVESLGLPDGVAGVIGGEWASEAARPARNVLSVEDPGSASPIAEICSAGKATIDHSVAVARTAGETWWRATSPAARGRALAQVATMIRQKLEELSLLEALDTGKPLWQTRLDVEISARYFEYYAGFADKQHGTTIPQAHDRFAYSVHEPYGVSLHITPWNSPIVQMCRGIAPAMAAGNSVVVKPSEVTPLSSVYFARLIRESSLPTGLCNVVLGTGDTAGDGLVSHADVMQISFTGSVKAGIAVMSAASRRVVPCNLELGGKSPTIVMKDADLERAARAAVSAMVRNAGQSCLATTRMLVHESRHDEFVELTRAIASKTEIGHALDNPDMGPVASEKQYNTILSYIASAKSDGADVIECSTLPGETEGYFIRPTLLVNANNSMSAVRNEIFGPVQSIIKFQRVEDAIAIANDSDYGLSAGVFTRNLSDALTIANRLQAGQVHINAYPAGGVETPFGGFKQSGIGREKGAAALDGYRQLKTVIAVLEDSHGE